MFAIVTIAGFQEKVSQGDRLKVPLLKGKAGDNVVFNDVHLLVKGKEDIELGHPNISGASVEAKIVEHGKAKKIRVFKMRRRKRYRRTHGHRQPYTEVEVVKISGGRESVASVKN